MRGSRAGGSKNLQPCFFGFYSKLAGTSFIACFFAWCGQLLHALKKSGYFAFFTLLQAKQWSCVFLWFSSYSWRAFLICSNSSSPIITTSLIPPLICTTFLCMVSYGPVIRESPYFDVLAWTIRQWRSRDVDSTILEKFSLVELR